MWFDKFAHGSAHGKIQPNLTLSHLFFPFFLILFNVYIQRFGYERPANYSLSLFSGSDLHRSAALFSIDLVFDLLFILSPFFFFFQVLRLFATLWVMTDFILSPFSRLTYPPTRQIARKQIQQPQLNIFYVRKGIIQLHWKVGKCERHYVTDSQVSTVSVLAFFKIALN